MNKILKYTLIGLGVAAVGTTLYFVFRKPKSEESSGETETKEEEKDTKESKPAETPASTDTSSSTSAAIKTAQPSQTGTGTSTKPASTATATKPVVNTDKLKGFNVQLVLSKTNTPDILKGKVVSADKNGTRLLDKNGKLVYTMKKGDNVGMLVGHRLTSKGDYLALISRKDDIRANQSLKELMESIYRGETKTYQTLASNLKFA